MTHSAPECPIAPPRGVGLVAKADELAGEIEAIAWVSWVEGQMARVIGSRAEWASR
jgi:hypothetical protein